MAFESQLARLDNQREIKLEKLTFVVMDALVEVGSDRVSTLHGAGEKTDVNKCERQQSRSRSQIVKCSSYPVIVKCTKQCDLTRRPRRHPSLHALQWNLEASRKHLVFL